MVNSWESATIPDGYKGGTKLHSSRCRFVHFTVSRLPVTQAALLAVLACCAAAGGQENRANAIITEVKQAIYELDYGGGQGMLLSPSFFQVSASGDVEPIREVVDFSASFIDKRYIFKGNVKEFLCNANAKQSPSGKLEPDYETRVVAAAASPSLSEAGIVEIDSNGFVRGNNAKSGWVNMPATLTYEEAGQHRFVRLYGATFWAISGGKDWISFTVDHATAGNDPASGGSPIPTETFITRDSNKSSAAQMGGTAHLRVGGRSFHPVLPTLSGKLLFDEDAPAAP